MQKNSANYTVLGAIAFLASMGITQWGNAETPKSEWYWTCPTTGAVVAEYDGQVRFVTAVGDTVIMDVAGIPQTPDCDPLPTYMIDYQWGVEVSLRVRGISENGHTGVWSLWSDPWKDDGPPGEPGKPSTTLNIGE